MTDDAPKKVLLIDDDEILNMMHKRILRKSKLPHEVLIATSGQDGLDLLEEHANTYKRLPDLILLDVNMPCMTGFEFLDEYAARKMGQKQSTKIVMLSSSLLVSDRERAAANPDVHLFADKMMPPEAFLALVDGLL